MTTLKVIAAATVIAFGATTASAGGLAPVAPPPAVEIIPAAPAATGSISPGLIVLGVVGALVAASASF